jgi:hypothetical protein
MCDRYIDVYGWNIDNDGKGSSDQIKVPDSKIATLPMGEPLY